MPTLTASEIQRRLLSGAPVEWIDANDRRVQLQLGDAKQRRLFSYLLSTNIREPIDLPAAFIAGLQTAFDDTSSPDPKSQISEKLNVNAGPWRLHSIETEGFGGLNTWNGSPFSTTFEGQSYFLEGPNGSGKSSLVGAILWALLGERPRDQSDAIADDAKPVFDAERNLAGSWPPVASYPPTAAGLKTFPNVRVQLTFVAPTGATATVERKLSGGKTTSSVSPNFSAPPVLIETGILMPARMGQLRFDEGGGRLTEAVQQLAGLDDLIAIGVLADGLCHKSREYRAYKSRELALLRSEFKGALEQARSELAAVGIDVPSFKPADTDIAVLTAQAINPREIAPPIVAPQGSLQLKKVIGVLFARDDFVVAAGDKDEICDCGGEVALTYLTADTLGLVEVDGRSAEPIALHEQYIIIKNPISPGEAMRTLDGKPIIAEDTKGSFYFKRLRSGASGIVLESLDSGGDYPPIVLAPSDGDRNGLAQVWPVVGILFEIPS